MNEKINKLQSILGNEYAVLVEDYINNLVKISVREVEEYENGGMLSYYRPVIIVNVDKAIEYYGENK